MLKKLNFVKHLIGVGAEETSESLMQVLVRWNPKRATEAERRMIAETLSKFCLKSEEARNKWKSEAADVVRVRQQAQQKIALMEKWQAEIQNLETSADRRSQLETRLPQLKSDLRQLSDQLDREIREEQIAKKILDTYDKVVATTEAKLAAKDDAAIAAASELELLKAQEHLANEEINAAKVIAGLTSATDSMDVATSAMNKEIEETKARIAAKEREAGILTGVGKQEDDFVAAELTAMSGSQPEVSEDDFLSSLKSKL